MMTKYIITMIDSPLTSYHNGKVYLVMPRGTCIYVSRVVYPPTSIINLLNFHDI